MFRDAALVYKILIDDHGFTWRSNSFELRQRLFCTKYNGDFQADVVRNLGFISVHRLNTRTNITLNLETVSAAALAGCFYWLGDNPQKSVVIQLVGNALPLIIAQSSNDAISRLVRITAKKILQERLHSKEVSPANLESGSPLLNLLRRWAESGSQTCVESLTPYVKQALEERYFVVKRTGSRELIFDTLGSGLKVPDKNWLSIAKGQTVESQPDKECWAWAAERHHLVLDTQSPSLTDIGADIYWPNSGWVNRIYRRLLLPCRAVDGAEVLLSVNYSERVDGLRAVA